MPTNQHIQPTWIPLCEAAKLAGISEAQLRQIGLAGKLAMRTIDAKLHIDVDALKRLGYMLKSSGQNEVCRIDGLIPSDIRDRACRVVAKFPSAKGTKSEFVRKAPMVLAASEAPKKTTVVAIPEPVILSEVILPMRDVMKKPASQYVQKIPSPIQIPKTRSFMPTLVAAAVFLAMLAGGIVFHEDAVRFAQEIFSNEHIGAEEVAAQTGAAAKSIEMHLIGTVPSGPLFTQ